VQSVTRAVKGCLRAITADRVAEQIAVSEPAMAKRPDYPDPFPSTSTVPFELE
jgi:hypothetical protein